MDAFWIIKSSFSLFRTFLARNQQENYPIFLMIFWFCPFYGEKMHEKKSKSLNADRKGLGKYLTVNFRHFLQPILMERRFFGQYWTIQFTVVWRQLRALGTIHLERPQILRDF